MTDGSDVSPEAAAGEIWGTLEELLLACAVSRHGTASWDSVATEVQTRSPLAARPRLTPRSCRLRFHHLHRRFSADGGAGEEEEAAEAEGQGEVEVEDPDASAADGWLEELRRLRVAELRREVERCDLSIGTLQSKVELMKEERERSVSASGEATTRPEEGATGEENVSSEEPGRSCRESNSTDLKRPGSVKEEAGEGAEKEEASGESMAASKESCRRGGRKAGGGTGGEEESEEAASVQQPLAALLDRVAARFGPVFERLQESQESESYRGTIRRHVDLDAMRRKLDDAGGGNGNSGYPTSELYRDLLLLCANAAVYLPRHAPEHAAAALNALSLVSAQVSASLREPPPPPPPMRELLLVGTVTAAALLADSRRGEADIVGPLIEKAAKPLIFCRKRSSIAKSAAAAAVARKEEAEKAGEAAKEAQEESDGEKKKAADVAVAAAATDKAWGMRAKKTRGPGKNSAKALAAKAAADEAAAATESDSNKKNGDATAAGGLPKKRIAVDFLKRLNQGASTSKKRGSPLTKRKRSAPAQEEEEQPKRRGPGRKSTGRGGSRRGGKAAGTKRSVGRPPAKRGAAAPSTPPPAKRAKVNRSERSSSSSRRGGRKST